MAQRSEIEAQRAAGPAVDHAEDYGPNGLRDDGCVELGAQGAGVTIRLAATFGLDHPFILIDNLA